MLFPIVGCYHTAEDLSHDAYLKASAANRIRPIAFARAFLFQTAKNLALDHLRKEKIRNQQVFWDAQEDDLEIPAITPTPEEAMCIDQQVEILHTILAGQSPQRREMLILHKIHGWRYDEIGQYLGLSRSAVEKNIRLALAHCLAAAADFNEA